MELLKLFSSVEEDRDDLVDGEQEYAEAEDDVGVEGDELVNSVLSKFIFATVGAVPCNPPSAELSFSKFLVWICIICSTIVLLIMLDISGLFVSYIICGLPGSIRRISGCPR